MVKSNNREFLPDIIKVMGIFMVVWIHSIQYLHGIGYNFFENIFYKWITMFNMPLFTFISGYFFSKTVKKYSVHNVIEKKFRSLIVPCVFWAIVLSPFHVIFDYKLNISIFSFIYSILRDSIGNFWFLKSIFLGSIIVICVEHYVKYKKILYFLIPLLFYYFFPPLYIVFTLPFFLLGFYYGNHYGKIHINNIAFVISTIGYIVFMLNIDVDHRAIIHSMNFFDRPDTGVHYLGLLKRYISAVLGMVMFIGLLERIKVTSKIQDKILTISNNTGMIYIMSSIMFYFLNILIREQYVQLNVRLNAFVLDIFVLIPLTCAIIYFCIKLNNYISVKPYLKKIMFGR